MSGNVDIRVVKLNLIARTSLIYLNVWIQHLSAKLKHLLIWLKVIALHGANRTNKSRKAPTNLRLIHMPPKGQAKTWWVRLRWAAISRARGHATHYRTLRCDPVNSSLSSPCLSDRAWSVAWCVIELCLCYVISSYVYRQTKVKMLSLTWKEIDRN